MAGNLLRRVSREHSEEGRTKQYPLRLTTSERTMLDAAASLHGMKLSRYLVEAGRSMAQGSTLGERRELVVELMQIRALLGRMGSNINQIARWANSNEAFPSDAATAVAHAKDLMIRIDAAVEKLV